MNIPEIEKNILKFWQKNKIFEKSLKKKSPKGDFVFYEGPPTANGEPGIHHVLARAFKDLIPRYKTMQGYHVTRKAGWDTHGLPVELEVEKELKLQNKKDVEEYGIEGFNKKCKDSAWKYKGEWEKMTERIGFWIDLENPYITYDNDYIETLWWIIKQAHKKGLLYKGHKVIPQCPRCGTALSSHEVAQGYKNIEEESVYVRFKLKKGQKIGDFTTDNETYILSWTTTPWTLPGNIALAINPGVEYSVIDIKSDFNRGVKGGELFMRKGKHIIASGKADEVINIEGNYYSKDDVIEKIKGKDLVGLEYEPLFLGTIKKSDENAENAFKIYPADFVSTEDGTGVVHTAVMYGIEDYELGEQIKLPKVHTVSLDGTFNELVPQWQGRFVKDADNEIVKDLRKRNLLYKTENYAHDYPFCWRCDTPLLYYAKDSWFFKMSDLRDRLIKNNTDITWVPEHIKEGRFGEWLRDVKDWAISRERYWGTPIPIWVCEKCEKMKVIGSREELGVDKKFDLHRPYIDEIKLKCECGETMNRIPEVMDCWFDSGAMPFAQFHYPFENKDLIDKEKQYPADFIAEAIDQTRGWFYTLLAISTILDKGTCYKNVICLGHVLDKKGQKMSKSLGNVVDFWEMIEKYGSDIIRWYLYTINQPGEPKRFDEQGLKESGRIFITLLNVVNFYKMFANGKIEDLKKSDLTNVLDRWINSKLNLLIKDITEKLDKYDITTTARKIEKFINDLSVRYVRRSRNRFKNGDKKAIKSLRRVIFNLIRLMAPFSPFITEHIYQEMKGREASVHLEEWPDTEKKLIDEKVLEKMKKVDVLIDGGFVSRSARDVGIRQPLNELRLSRVYDLGEDYLKIVKSELNIQNITFSDKEGIPSKKDKNWFCFVDIGDYYINFKITPKLKEEGMVREFIRQIQAERKKQGLVPKDKIKVYYSENKEIIEKNKEEIKKSVIATDVIHKEGEKLKIEKV